jgi:hypothetical protein
MAEDNVKTELEAITKRIAKLAQVLTRVETKLDTLLSSVDPSPANGRLQAEQRSVDQDEDVEWMEGLDGITRFNLEQGWTTREEVRKGMKEG